MRQRKYTDEQLLQILLDKAKQLGRAPKVLDVQADPDCPNPGVFIHRFGSWNNALIAAGLKPNLVFAHRLDAFSAEQLVQVLQELYAELGRTPRVRDLAKHKEQPTYNQFLTHFGSFTNALNAAGVPLNVTTNNRACGLKRIRRIAKRYSREQLIALLQAKYRSLGQSPTRKDADLDVNMPRAEVYVKEFGSWNQALTAANIPLAKRKWDKF